MKKLVTLLLVSLFASLAYAGLDPGTDSFGIYFDTAGNTNCTTAAPFQPVSAYLILMNPAGPTNGIECSVVMSGAPYVVLSTSCICPFEGCWFEGDDIWAVCAANFLVPANGAVVIVTWSIMLQAPEELLFHIGPSSIPSLPGGLPVVTGDGVLRRGAVASGDVNLPVAGINAAFCTVSENARSFGEVKSLFR